MIRLLVAAVCATLLVGAGSPATARTASNGFWLNTSWTNSPWLNGFWLNGFWLNGEQLVGDVYEGYIPGSGSFTGGEVDWMFPAGVTQGGQPVRAYLRGSEIVGWVDVPACPSAPPTDEPCRMKKAGVGFEQFHQGSWFIGASIEISVLPYLDSVAPVCGAGTNHNLSLDPWRPPLVAPLRIESVSISGGIARYEMVIHDTKHSGQYLCGTNGTTPVPVIPLQGAWDQFPNSGGRLTGGGRIGGDDNRVTFACENAVLGECAAQLGYRPWAKPAERTGPAGDPEVASWTQLHQACVRMVRADICGDGKSFTVPGTLINVDDRFGVQTYSRDPGLPPMVFEGYWDAGGILAQDCARYETLAAQVLYEGSPCPALDRVARACPAAPIGGDGSGLAGGTGISLVADPARWLFSGGGTTTFTALLRNEHVETCNPAVWSGGEAVTLPQLRH